MKIYTDCPHDRNPKLDYKKQVLDYKPLAKSTIRKMLKMAMVANNRIVNKIQVRLTQAIPVHVCPHPSGGRIAEKMCKVDAYYVYEFLDDRRRIGYHANRLYSLINA